MRVKIILIILILCLAGQSFGDAKKNSGKSEIEQLQEIQSLEDLTTRIDQLQLLAESISKKKELDCIKAFGNREFCSCLRDNLPVVISFPDYVSIITLNKEEIGYNGLSNEDKKLVDTTIATRETCVAKAVSR